MSNAVFESRVIRVPVIRPATFRASRRCSTRGEVDPSRLVAIMEQTEGDPYARGYATLAGMEVLLSERLGISRRQVFDTIPMMMIGGVGGIICPHIILLFIRQPGSGDGGRGKRLALGVASSRALSPEEYGTMIQVDPSPRPCARRCATPA